MKQRPVIEIGQGNPTLVEGHFWSVKYAKWICHCSECGAAFLAKRPHTLTCSVACRKRRSRRLGAN